MAITYNSSDDILVNEPAFEDDWLQDLFIDEVKGSLNRGGGGGGSSVQSDLAQNDETAADYVKNRTHYEDGDYVKTIENKFLPEHLQFGSVVKNIELVPTTTIASGSNSTRIADSEILVEGNIYKVIWNGVEYIRTAKKHMPIIGDTHSCVCIGNLSTNNESVQIDDFEIMSTRGYTSARDRTKTGGTLALYLLEEVHAIDPKFLENSSIGLKGTSFGAEIFNDTLRNVASGDFSHAEGADTRASGVYSHAEGYFTKATDEASHAEGHSTNATGRASHAEGLISEATGSAAHAEGASTVASGNFSHAEGYGTTASGSAQHVQGRFNIKDTSDKYAHIVGNGSGFTNFSNAHTLDWDGNAWFAGTTIKLGGTSQDDTNAKEVALKSDIPTMDAIYNAMVSRFPLAEGGSY